MKLLVIGEYIRKMTWSPSAWAVAVASGLARRGHQVLVACDGLEDPAVLGDLPRLVRRPRRTVRGADPLGFQRWAAAVRARLSDHLSISLTPWSPAQVWIRLDAESAATTLRAVRGHRPLSAVLELLHRPWLPAALLAERRADHAGTRARRLSFSASADEQCAPLLMHASRFSPPSEAESALATARLRSLLGLAPSRTLLLLSAIDVHRPGLEAFFAGLARVRSPAASPVALVLGRRCHTVSAIARSAGCPPGAVRHLGAAADVAPVFAACDAAVVAGPDRGGSAGARFLADALRAGRPVLAHRDAPGAALLEPAHFGTAPLGLLCDGSPESWARAVENALADGWMPRAHRAARDAGPALSLDGLLDRLERQLLTC